jgi:CheY-like chemotaxis protein
MAVIGSLLRVQPAEVLLAELGLERAARLLLSLGHVRQPAFEHALLGLGAADHQLERAPLPGRARPGLGDVVRHVVLLSLSVTDRPDRRPRRAGAPSCSGTEPRMNGMSSDRWGDRPMTGARVGPTVTGVAITLHAFPVRDHPGMPPARVKVVVADDHPLFREGIERAVRERPELELVGSAEDGREALDQIREQEPAVAVLDLRLPGLDGLQVLNALTRDGLPTRVLFLSASGDPELVYQAVQGGAAGYFRKEADRQAILDAIMAVSRGRTVSRSARGGPARTARSSRPASGRC